jgi:hypothetical protein
VVPSRNWTFHYRVHENPLLYSNMSQLNPVHLLTRYFLRFLVTPSDIFRRQCLLYLSSICIPIGQAHSQLRELILCPLLHLFSTSPPLHISLRDELLYKKECELRIIVVNQRLLLLSSSSSSSLLGCKTHRTITFPVLWQGSKAWFPLLRKKRCLEQRGRK